MHTGHSRVERFFIAQGNQFAVKNSGEVETSLQSQHPAG